MIPPPTGLRRFKSVELRKAKRSLPQQFSFWSSDRPSPHHLSQPPKAALRNAQGPSGPQQVVGSANQQVVRMIPPPAGGGASIIVAGSQRLYATMVRRLAIPRLARQRWRSRLSAGRWQVVG